MRYRPPKRTILHALIDGIGPVSVEELLAAPRERWELWRAMITDEHQRKEGPRNIARCMACGKPVFIRVSIANGEKRPLFHHFAGADDLCPWFTGDTVSPDEARGAQYRGRQESAAHRMLCELIAELARADVRTKKADVERYLRPTDNGYGRYPDVYIDWEAMKPFAVEVQLSRTLETEISERTQHYPRQGVSLVWVLYGVDLDSANFQQSFRDVLIRHRMNGFFIDHAAVAASREQRTLVLSCRLYEGDEKFGPSQLVRLDELTFPESGLPYIEDCLTPLLLRQARNLREKWFRELRSAKPDWVAPIEPLAQACPDFAPWSENRYNQQQFGDLVAVLFSVITFSLKKFENFATKQDNVKAMLNSRLSSTEIAPYATLIREFLRRTAPALLNEPSVAKHIDRAERREPQIASASPEWMAVALLLPEVFNDATRTELAVVGSLPKWVVPH